MEKINCNVIGDLLPLYVDGVLSDDSRELVDEHLSKCDNCRESAEKMKNTLVIANDTDSRNIKKLKKKVNIKKITAVSVSSVLAVLVLFGLSFYLFYYGNAVSSDEVIVKRGFVKSDKINNNCFDQQWIIDFELKSGKALTAVIKDIYSEDSNGNKAIVGKSIELREVPIGILYGGSDVKVNCFTYGYSIGYSHAPNDVIDEIRLSTMDGEGRYSKQEDEVITSKNSIYATEDTPENEAVDFDDEIITVIYKDMRVTYSMKKEGLFEKQEAVERIEDLPVVSDLPNENR